MSFFFFQVNVEDINQLLAYHEVFGKLQNEMAVAAGTVTAGAVLQSPGGVKSSCSEVGGAGGSNTATASTATSPVAAAVITAPGTHICDICSKIFPFRYQLIVHRRYHTERKPFTCQVSTSPNNIPILSVGECFNMFLLLFIVLYT
jgi:KRAB domain-containing zinc finger protein